VPEILLERDGDLGSLLGLVDGLVDRGEGGVAIVEGPPGLGKTRLLEATVEHARARQVRLLRGTGSELEFELAFGAVRQFLGPTLARLDPATRRAVLRGPASMAPAILGAGAPYPDRREPMYALAALLSGLAEHDPVFLAADDIQWFDEESARFLAYLARRVEGQRILIVATRRPVEPGAADTARELSTSAPMIRPQPLTVDGVGRLAESILGSPVGPGLAAACARVTGGNPFLVVEVARALVGAPDDRRAEMVDEIAPRSIGAAVLSRIHRLPPPAAGLADAIALFPKGTTLAVAAAVADIPQAVAARAADTLVAAHALSPGTRLAFEHPVMRSAVYEQLGRFGRRSGHARAADVLLERDADVEEVAAHLLAGEPSGDRSHVAVLEAAATRAERAGAFSAAARYLARALEEPPPTDDRFALGHRLGRLQAQIGSPDAVGTLRQAFERAVGDERVAVAIDLASAARSSGRYDEAVRTLLEVREAARNDREERLIVEALLSHFAWASEEYGALYAEAADGLPGDLPGTTPGERLALGQIGARMFDRCEPYEATAEVLWRSMGDDASPPVAWAVELGDTLNLVIRCGRLDDAEAFCRRRQDEARATGRDALYAWSIAGLTAIESLRGDLAGCEATLRLAMELPGNPADQGVIAGYLATLCITKGGYTEARTLLDLAVASGGLAISVPWRRGELELALGRPARAVTFYEEALDLMRRRHALNPAESVWIADFAGALASIGRRNEAMELVGDYVDRAQSFGEPRALGIGHMALGRLAAGEGAVEHLERAVATLEPSPYRFDAARARLELGAALRRVNRRLDSRQHLRLALDYADRNGVEPMAARAQDELAAGGARPRRRALVGVDALTPSEQRIARLAADGMTNREIATHLFVTVKTVEMHLGRSFEKLGTESRRELAHVLEPVAPNPTTFGSVS
jgi:DNA-binding CsgD family transcriptional regulator